LHLFGLTAGRPLETRLGGDYLLADLGPALDSATRRYAKCAPEASAKVCAVSGHKARKGSGLWRARTLSPVIFLLRRKLAAHALDVCAEVEFELVLRELDVALHIHQAHGRRVAVLLDYFGLHRHA